MCICLCLIFCNLAFIWGNSLLPAPVSSAFSNWVGDILAAILPSGGSTGGGHGLLRKLAHFTEFASLGILLSWFFAMLQKKFPVPLLCGFLAACVDETIQRFVPGRGPSFRDVCIDTSGALLGVLVFLTGLTIYQKHQKRKLLEDNTL